MNGLGWINDFRMFLSFNRRYNERGNEQNLIALRILN